MSAPTRLSLAKERRTASSSRLDRPPAYDHAQITGIAAAHVGYELLSALAARKAAGSG